MEELLAWARGLVAMAVAVTLLDLLLPEGGLRGAVRTVMGLAVAAAMVGPALQVVENLRATGLPGRPAGWRLQFAAAGPQAAPTVQETGIGQQLWEEALLGRHGLLAAGLAQAMVREGWQPVSAALRPGPAPGTWQLRVGAVPREGAAPEQRLRQAVLQWAHQSPLGPALSVELVLWPAPGQSALPRAPQAPQPPQAPEAVGAAGTPGAAGAMSP